MTQPTDSGLRPCPFCKSDALRLEQTSPLHFSVNCNSCGSQIHRITEAEAISAWNTRPSAPADEAVKLAIEAMEMGGAHNGRCHPSEDIICTNCQTRSKALTTLYNLEAKLNGGK